MLIATDPDADRLGVAVLHDDTYHYLSGNQLGALLLHYKLTLLRANNANLDNAVAIKTIVTSELGRKIAHSFGIRSEAHTSELQSRGHLVCRLLLEKKN